MKSPFPGMDPYLERHWRDVHASLVVYARDWLQDRLPPGLRARIEERVFVESSWSETRGVYPDVRVVEHPNAGPAGGTSTRAITDTIAEPLLVHLDFEPLTEGYVEIVDAGSGNRVLTTIEFLSLSNKQPGAGRKAFLQKQQAMIEGRVSVVEIDLLRSGERAMVVPAEHVPPNWQTAYQACVLRAWNQAIGEVYRIDLRSPLPTIPVPLRETDEATPLSLQALIDQCYRHGGYEDIDYKVDPEPPLSRDDAAWADELLRAAGLR